jgi:hypothetical protein
VASREPLRRAQLLAEAQAQLAWALSAAVAQCQEGDSKRTWAAIGEAIGMPRETAYRQFTAGGPMVVTKPVQSTTSSNLGATRADDVDAIYAFETEGGDWLGSPEKLPTGQHITAVLNFRPSDEGNAFANQMLRVRIGRLREDVTFHAAQVQLPDGSERRVRVTYEVLNLLFEDGQTPLRRALTALVHACLGNPAVDPNFQGAVREAMRAQVASTPTAELIHGSVMPAAEFVEAVVKLIEAGRNATPLDVHAIVALRRLENVVAAYDAWANARTR